MKEQQWNLIAHLPLAYISLSIFPANMVCLYTIYPYLIRLNSLIVQSRRIVGFLFSTNCLSIDFKVCDWLCKSVYRWINCWNLQYVYICTYINLLRISCTMLTEFIGFLSYFLAFCTLYTHWRYAENDIFTLCIYFRCIKHFKCPKG